MNSSLLSNVSCCLHSDNIADDEYYATLLPGELESPTHIVRDDSMNFDTESLMQSGKYSLNSPDYILNSSLRFEDFKNNRELVTSSPVDMTSPLLVLMPRWRCQSIHIQLLAS